MTPARVILVQPPICDFYLTKKRTLPYGLMSIAAGLQHDGYEVSIIDALATDKFKRRTPPADFDYLEPYYAQKDISQFCLFHDFRHFGYSFEHIGKLIREQEPLLVGISALFTAYSDQAMETARAIKKFYPQCTLVMGGHHPTHFPETVLSHPAVDLVIRGEGETPMRMLCQAILEKTPIEEVPGIAFIKNGQPFINPPYWEKDLSALPLPVAELSDQKFYRRRKRRAMMVVSSRGCPMPCSYCSVSRSSGHGAFRQRDVDGVIREIKTALDADDVGFIDFEDENLCLKKDWFMDLFSRLSFLTQHRDIELRAMNGLFPPAIDEDIVAMMARAGFKTLNLSLGSTSKEQLKRFCRPDVRKSLENALVLAEKYKLECVSYLIAAAPYQPAEDSLKDLLYLAGRRTLVGLSIFYPAPGSPDFEVCEKTGILPPSFARMRSSALPLSHTTTRLQSVTLLRLSRILNYMKSRIDRNVDDSGTLPDPEQPPDLNSNAAPDSVRLSLEDRNRVSEKLLAWFLYDGLIRGVDRSGQIFCHEQDHSISHEFAQKIQQIQICGVKTGPAG